MLIWEALLVAGVASVIGVLFGMVFGVAGTRIGFRDRGRRPQRSAVGAVGSHRVDRRNLRCDRVTAPR